MILFLFFIGKSAAGRNVGGIRIFIVDTTESTIYAVFTMSYEVEIEFKESILLCTYDHNRQGLQAAFDKINQLKKELIAAIIISDRDGVIYRL